MNGNMGLVATAVICLDDKTRQCLNYYLVTHRDKEKERYALRIEKLTPEGDIIEFEETPAFTDLKDKAERMTKAFSDGTVTPCTLLEMAAEWLGTDTHPPSIHTAG